MKKVGKSDVWRIRVIYKRKEVKYTYYDSLRRVGWIKEIGRG